MHLFKGIFHLIEDSAFHERSGSVIMGASVETGAPPVPCALSSFRDKTGGGRGHFNPRWELPWSPEPILGTLDLFRRRSILERDTRNRWEGCWAPGGAIAQGRLVALRAGVQRVTRECGLGGRGCF